MLAQPSEFSELLQLAAAGDDSRAIDRIVEHAADQFVALARKMLRSNFRLRRWEETDDIYQEAVIRLCRALREVPPQSTNEFFGLAALQIRRTLIDLARHHFGPHGDAGNRISDPLLQMRNAPDAVDRSCEPQSLLQWTAFHEAVERLPNDERGVFDAVFYGNATYEEAAKLLNITRRTAIRRMNRARVLLARYLSEDSVSPWQ